MNDTNIYQLKHLDDLRNQDHHTPVFNTSNSSAHSAAYRQVASIQLDCRCCQRSASHSCTSAVECDSGSQFVPRRPLQLWRGA